MTLGDIVRDLDSLSGDLCIVARRPWSGSSEAMLVRIGPDPLPQHVKDAGFEYFIEVYILRDEVFGDWSASLNTSERLSVATYYAENDAYPQWLNERLRS